MKYTQTIGVVGGMGSYATLGFFERLLKAFPAEKEWDRPRIIIDNRCTMPSRVRAILYEEERPRLVEELSIAAQGLIACGANHIVFACNTSHIFLPEVFDAVPSAREKTIHMIAALAKEMQAKKVTKAFLLASEGTIESNIYPLFFQPCGIEIKTPHQKEYAEIRKYIETAKQGKLTYEIKERFSNFIHDCLFDDVILGCTEFPLLMEHTESNGVNGIWDPLASVIQVIKDSIQ